jgi:hypothetical protein
MSPPSLPPFFIVCLFLATYDPSLSLSLPPQPSLMDSFDYVMHGRIFSLDYVGQHNQQVEAQVSFGGLLLKVRGEQAQLSALEADMK